MDQHQFDSFTVTLAQPESRRRVVQLLGAAAFGALSIAALTPTGSDARKRKRGKKSQGRCLKSGDPCNSDKQCCGGNLICDVPTNASNSDRECCGDQGAVCGGVNDDGDAQPPFCCVGEAGKRSFVCSESDPNNPGVRGTCIPAPEA